jgi:predicted DsbA family dithiol-disulfide isomerase
VRTERLVEQYRVETRLTQFPLHPDTPPEGMALAELFAGREEQLAQAHARLAALMAEAGLPFAERTHTYNSRLAQELGKWAGTVEGGEALHDALFRAYFAEVRDISRIDVLLDVVRGVGQPVDAARRALEERTFREVVDRDWQRARELGVTGVPTYAAGGYAVVGAQPYEVLEELVTHAGAERANRRTAGD